MNYKSVRSQAANMKFAGCCGSERVNIDRARSAVRPLHTHCIADCRHYQLTIINCVITAQCGRIVPVTTKRCRCGSCLRGIFYQQEQIKVSKINCNCRYDPGRLCKNATTCRYYWRDFFLADFYQQLCERNVVVLLVKIAYTVRIINIRKFYNSKQHC